MSIEPLLPHNRRDFLARSSFGVGAFALAHLLRQDGLLAADGPAKPGENLPLDLRPRPPHHAPKATAMISLFMHGGPSHVDLFDPKPELSKQHGKEYGGEVTFSFVNRASKKLLGSPLEVRQARTVRHGRLGAASRNREDGG